MIYQGSCHCGAVKFELDAPEFLEVDDCNCSICVKSGCNLHVIRPLSAIRLLQGESNLATYTYGTHIARHRFCKTCGCKPFYTPRSNPDGVDVNFRCLDTAPPDGYTITPFDGQNWEKNAHTLAHKSQGD